jgi:hypothetical protein
LSSDLFASRSKSGDVVVGLVFKVQHQFLAKLQTITKYLNALKNGWKDGWETDSLQSSYVGTQGRNDFHRNMVKAIQKTYKEFVQ